MATYKVIQDIEAEDKLVGPFTLRQFIYMIIVAACLFIGYQFAKLQPLLVIPLLFPATLFGFLAAPFGHDQPNEVWLLAKIRFALKPRKRIWDQSGMLELVTINVPKKIEKFYTNGLSQHEVHSRLNALANTLDSRGWAVKNVNINLYGQPSYLADQTESDRLINPNSLPQNVPSYTTTAFDDVLDEQSNPTAQHFNEMIAASEQTRRQTLTKNMQQATAPQSTSNLFVKSTGGTATDSKPVKLTAEEKAVLDKIHEDKSKRDPAYAHLHTIDPHPKNDATPKKHAAPKEDKPVTPTPDPAIIQLANNDDLSVETIARQANKARTLSTDSSDEVVISLH